jgi:hypothetical protein
MRPVEPAASSSQPVRVSGWQHFFIWGWAPAEKKIDAAGKCGGAENLDSIRTEETFLQGLVQQFAGYYINIYSPWNAEIYCREAPPETAAAP